MNKNPNKIRVCFIAMKAYPIFNPAVEKVFGGAEVDLYLLATELAKDLRFDVRFVVGDYGQPDGEIRQGVTLYKSTRLKQNPLTGAVHVWKALRQADADIYMLKTASPGVPLVACFCRKHKRRLIYKTASQEECNGKYLRRHPVLGSFFLHSLKNASQVIVQNRQDQDNLKRCLGLDSIVFANGHRITQTAKIAKQTILWVGRSAAIKRPQRFLELTAAFPQERFVMICSHATGDKEYNHLRHRACERENLMFYEHIAFDKIERFFEEAKVLVNTSQSEGFPNTFIQACKAGTAILSDVVNPDSFLTEYRCGMCGDGTRKMLFSNLKSLLTNNLYLEMGQNGLRYVCRKHNIEIIVEQYKTLFGQWIQ